MHGEAQNIQENDILICIYIYIICLYVHMYKDTAIYIFMYVFKWISLLLFIYMTRCIYTKQIIYLYEEYTVHVQYTTTLYQHPSMLWVVCSTYIQYMLGIIYMLCIYVLYIYTYTAIFATHE